MAPLVAVVLTGCGAATPPTTSPAAVPNPAAVPGPAATASVSGVESVGRVTGTDTLVAVVTDGARVVAYVCDGPAGLGERFFGTLDGDRAVLRSERGAELGLTVADGGAAGSFTAAGGTPAAFTTTAVSRDAGLFFADGIVDGQVYGAGWIVLADGTQTGTETRNRRESRLAPRLERKAVEIVGRTRPPTTTAASRPDTGGGRENPARARLIDRTALAGARLCATDPARCE
ncbi:hypothetical protein I4I73_29515 [Pseudonocardia sp. KRD-184]|uniref:Uncharacterized protein n=1 Tax=Pseudonocardia oceani TaxID=2792013 RepID=A0ABS6UBG5_9PSEU|nr:hypothetical protein [Pseudonocardia oceani]MBW0093391.1 hypothetical protein [Pseudonocardia oceani]MBW0100122.1 hypothetical protein [Pseudonocardia oceani]MBW0112814.1 hypothetical protein [Pseudonocardia oceani]MBW0125788.1 hypothetical protein [Pseudonocardia oceani]MBW0129565.1 hypothetical protein [Pseudonocardia oceani]